MLQAVKKLGGRGCPFLTGEELGWEAQGAAVDKLGGTAADVRFKGSAYAQEHEWQNSGPVSSMIMGHQGGF